MKNKFIKTIASIVTSASIIGGTAIPTFAEPVTVDGTTSVSTPTTVSFTQKDSMQMTISDNVITFGDVNMIASTDATKTITATIKSSQGYTVSALANEDFKSAGDDVIPVSKLGVSVDGGSFSNFVKSTEKTLSTDAASYEVGTSHVLSFKLDNTVGYKAGSYTAPLIISVVQK